MEGLLLVPPDKAAILGRSMWKVCIKKSDMDDALNADDIHLDSIRDAKFRSTAIVDRWNAFSIGIDAAAQLVTSTAQTWVMERLASQCRPGREWTSDMDFCI